MTQLEALHEAITALSNAETLSRRCAHESFTAESDRRYWLQAASRAKDARHVLVDVLQCIKQEKSDASI